MRSPLLRPRPGVATANVVMLVGGLASLTADVPRPSVGGGARPVAAETSVAGRSLPHVVPA
ncbi:MAG TPA: hypothetical protein VIS06_10070, partial [Mycobacteriales bacterium]